MTTQHIGHVHLIISRILHCQAKPLPDCFLSKERARSLSLWQTLALDKLKNHTMEPPFFFARLSNKLFSFMPACQVHNRVVISLCLFLVNCRKEMAQFLNCTTAKKIVSYWNTAVYWIYVVQKEGVVALMSVGKKMLKVVKLAPRPTPDMIVCSFCGVIQSLDYIAH